MHDPMIVAFEIPRPWPSRSRNHDTATLRERDSAAPRFQWRYRHKHFRGDLSECGCAGRTQAQMFPWWKPGSYSKFMTLFGKGFYWPAMITVWHVEPNGHDSGEVCRNRRTRNWHIHHWKVQFRPLQTWRRWLLTRCDWCGGKSRKRDVVNHSHSWDGPKNRWWRGEKGLFHEDCSIVESAYRTCTCPDPMLDHEGYGKCALCSRFRGYGANPRWLANAEKVRAAIPERSRDKAAYRGIFPPLAAPVSSGGTP